MNSESYYQRSLSYEPIRNIHFHKVHATTYRKNVALRHRRRHFFDRLGASAPKAPLGSARLRRRFIQTAIILAINYSWARVSVDLFGAEPHGSNHSTRRAPLE